MQTPLGWSAEKPELTVISPPGGQIGTTVDVSASGKFPTWPLQIWSDSEAIQWNCMSDSGKLQVKISGDAIAGVHWVRLYSPSGATASVPFLVGKNPESNEAEPNDRVAEANEVPSLARTTQGILNKRGDVDLFAVTLKKDELLIASVDSQKWLSSPADVCLQILDSKGYVLSENLDHVGLDPQLTFRARGDGKYHVKVFGFPAAPDTSIGFGGGNDWVYRLHLDSDSSFERRTLDYSMLSLIHSECVELTAGQHAGLDQALSVVLPVKVTGTIAEPGQVKYLRFAAKAGVYYRIRLLAREFGSSLDPTIAILDSQGNQIVQQDDIETNLDPVLKWKAPSDGDFTISIVDFHRLGGSDYGFLAVLEEWPVSFSATLSSDLIHAVTSKETEVIVNLARESEFSGTINVTAEGLPSFVQCSSAESKYGTDSASKVTLKFTGSEAFQGPIKIFAKALEPTNLEQVAKTLQSKPTWLSITSE